MKKLYVLLIALFAVSCADQNARYDYLKKKYPHCRIVPGGGTGSRMNADFILVDTSGTSFIVNFYPFSETKIANMHRLF